MGFTAGGGGRRRRGIAGAALVALAGCGGAGKTDGDGDGHGGHAPSRFEEYIFVDKAGVETTGDFSGFTAGETWETTTWLTQTVAAPTDTMAIEGVVEDFEREHPVSDALVELWFDDVVDASVDVSVTSDVNGDVVLEAPACTKMAYRVSTEPALDLTKITYKAHHVYTYDESGVVDDGLFTSVSSTTYQLIPTLLGVSVDPELAIIAGTAYDVARDAAAPTDDDLGKIEGAQVIVYDDQGNIPDTLQVNYFIEDFPDRSQEWTSADGLWVASNVPPGNLRVELWGNLDGVLTLLGATILYTEADSINIGNVFAGYGDGVKYPAACE